MMPEKYLNTHFCEETRKLIRKIADKEQDLMVDYDALALRMKLMLLPGRRHIQVRKDLFTEDAMWLYNLEQELGKFCGWGD